MVTQNGDGGLRHHVNHSTSLITRSGGKEVVILRKLKVNDGVAVDREGQVNLGELLAGVQQTNIAFFITDSNQAVVLRGLACEVLGMAWVSYYYSWQYRMVWHGEHPHDWRTYGHPRACYRSLLSLTSSLEKVLANK